MTNKERAEWLDIICDYVDDHHSATRPIVFPWIRRVTSIYQDQATIWRSKQIAKAEEVGDKTSYVYSPYYIIQMGIYKVNIDIEGRVLNVQKRNLSYRLPYEFEVRLIDQSIENAIFYINTTKIGKDDD